MERNWTAGSISEAGRVNVGARAYLKPVMDGAEVISAYERLLEFSSTMLEHAREDDWTKLIESEVAYVSEVERLQKHELDAMLTEQQQEQKLVFLDTLLKQDKEIRQRLTQRRAELEKMLSTASKKRKVDNAYLS
ncbi:Flagellar protein FliT [Idiomarina sp. A28L]|uniref:flagellar protein FliT n=1 Tax=Idiomarina sp. A28L TaxID=1036674 RepID=UPI0002138BF5|nr:flagellar protein FliT [Idiomarina sp. A28L]EGN75969.1 Flagellar protein FliT [Idiomarina sp. A28L]